MQSDNPPPYDTSFAYSYNWGSPKTDLKAALEIINSRKNEHEESGCCPATMDEYHLVCCLLAGNPHCPKEVLEHISECVTSDRILERVASNPNTSVETLRRLALTGSAEVRSAVAENVNADAETIELLVNDENIDVRFQLAENHQLPEEILSQLSFDENPYVAYRAQLTRAHMNPQKSSSVQAGEFQRKPTRIRRAV